MHQKRASTTYLHTSAATNTLSFRRCRDAYISSIYSIQQEHTQYTRTRKMKYQKKKKYNTYTESENETTEKKRELESPTQQMNFFLSKLAALEFVRLYLSLHAECDEYVCGYQISNRNISKVNESSTNTITTNNN